MGYNSAADMAAHTDLDTALRWHLQANHYPPIPSSMIDVAKAAIDAYNDEEYDRLIELPEGVESRTHGKQVPATAVFEELHLDGIYAGLQAQDEPDEDEDDEDD